ncbi:hypothetical protein Y032_1044g3482 [Ancylostoma ceylanicum]|uniref:Uncharacterized protein n=1 Tax=Ancylostoma ceylanicum TaxID=53326 RepID=A0A016W769_9BILA|nr:hypothetical protein Y032_1044g3482 [Ancylostoma ceylanicum]
MLQNLPSVLFLQRRRHSAVEKGARPTPADVVFGRRLLSFPRSSVGGVGWPIAHRGTSAKTRAGEMNPIILLR